MRNSKNSPKNDKYLLRIKVTLPIYINPLMPSYVELDKSKEYETLRYR